MSNKYLSFYFFLCGINISFMNGSLVEASSDSQPCPFQADLNLPPPTPAALFYPQLEPNAFTSASWSIPELQDYILQPIPGFKAAETYFYALDSALDQLGNPNHATIANAATQNLAGIEQFTFALYLHVKGQALQKFLKSEGFEIDTTLAQKYADTLQDYVISSGATSFDELVHPLLDGYVNFVKSLGFNVADRAYVIAVLFSQEELACQRLNA